MLFSKVSRLACAELCHQRVQSRTHFRIANSCVWDTTSLRAHRTCTPSNLLDAGGQVGRRDGQPHAGEAAAAPAVALQQLHQGVQVGGPDGRPQGGVHGPWEHAQFARNLLLASCRASLSD